MVYLLPPWNWAADIAAHAGLATGVHSLTDYQGRRIQLFNPYIPRANCYKVQLHTHTTNSDGVDSPTALMTAYKNAGYDACAITDHDHLTPDPSVSGILYIPGVEESLASGHILNLFCTAQSIKTTLQGEIDDILLDGALASPAHPWFTIVPITVETLYRLLGYQSVEIMNSVMALHGLSICQDTHWVSLLTGNKNVWAIAGDDCHNIVGVAFNKCFVEIMADSLSLATLKESLREGNFYVRQTGAPQLTLTQNGNILSCAMGASSNIEWVGRNGLVLKSESGVTSSNYTVGGWEGFVFARVKDNATTTYYSYTQPIYILTPSITPQLSPCDMIGQSDAKAYAAYGTDQIVPSAVYAPVLLTTIDHDNLGEFDLTQKTGTATATTANHLIDTTLNQFTAADVGAGIWNTTDNTVTWVTAYNSPSDLTLYGDIMANGENYKLYRSMFIPKASGTYLVSGIIRYQTGVVADKRYYTFFGINMATLALTGTVASTNHHASVNEAVLVDLCTTLKLIAGDKLTLVAYHTAGSNVTLGVYFHNVNLSVLRLT